MKLIIFLLFILSGQVWAQNCDVRVGTTMGLKVMEFYSGNTIHSKMTIRETTAEALIEELSSLQDEGMCSERIPAGKCVLRFEKRNKTNLISFFRNNERWATWMVKSKSRAQAFVKNMKRVGLCL